MQNVQDMTPQQWEQLAKKKIYFGHQSVGYNILDGIRSLMKEHPEIKLNIVETRDSASFDRSVFAHSTVGRNEDPISKTDDFVKVMDSGVGGKADIAFHKYCFIDVNGSTDVEIVFSHYRERMDYLKLQYPDTRFIHITIPLTTIQTGPKALIKKMLGKPIGGLDANAKRNEFNQLLLSTYKDKDPVFDLARAEATQPDGAVTTFTRDGKKYFTLYKGYTTDGGHLNTLGQKVIAEKLLIFLSQIDS